MEKGVNHTGKKGFWKSIHKKGSKNGCPSFVKISLSFEI